MQKGQEISKLEKEITYYKLGDNISREQIQEELAKIKAMQEGVNRLTTVVTERRRILMANVFGEHIWI